MGNWSWRDFRCEMWPLAVIIPAGLWAATTRPAWLVDPLLAVVRFIAG